MEYLMGVAMRQVLRTFTGHCVHSDRLLIDCTACIACSLHMHLCHTANALSTVAILNIWLAFRYQLILWQHL